MSRVLALDPGSRRIGIAISDTNRIIAQPLMTLEVAPDGAHLAQIVELAASREVAVVLVGQPLNMDGSLGAEARRAEKLAEQLASRLPEGIRVQLWDERLTTAQAERVLLQGGVRRGKRRQVRDKLAATILLQSYLGSQQSEEQS